MVAVVWMNVIPLFCCQIWYNYMELPYHEYIKKTHIENFIPVYDLDNNLKTVRYFFHNLIFIYNFRLMFSIKDLYFLIFMFLEIQFYIYFFLFLYL